MKTGSYFISIIKPCDLTKTQWDPHFYQQPVSGEKLGQFMEINRPSRKAVGELSHIGAIEYKDIQRNALSFEIDMRPQTTSILPFVGEQQLLFGTMRAYLGNIIVTPRGEWIGMNEGVVFDVKSEFLHLVPYDGAPYFWLAYLRSPSFLGTIPLGTGGTRPRLSAEDLARLPVQVPSEDVRRKIHRRFSRLARISWELAGERQAMVARYDLT